MEYNDDSDEESEYSEESDNHDFHCTNLDPALAKLMGIIIEEQKTDWTPPSFSGLHNSTPIIQKSDAMFSTIKDNIRNFRKLSSQQLDYIKGLDENQKYEIIQIYNECLMQMNKK